MKNKKNDCKNKPKNIKKQNKESNIKENIKDKKDNFKRKEEINQDKSLLGLKTKRQNLNNSLKDNSYPNKLFDCKDLIKDNISDFIVFNSINDILTLIYCNKKKIIISYNLKENKKIIEIKRKGVDTIIISRYPIHREYSYSFKHYQDKKNKRDLILFNDLFDIKIFDNNTFECISTMNYFPVISDFLISNNKIYIISYGAISNGLFNLYNLNGELIKNLNFSFNYVIINLEIYYDHKSYNIFIIIVSQASLLSYNYTKDELYHNYSKISYENNKINIIVDENITKLIWSDILNITIFDFHNGNILNIISPKEKIQNLCIWNNQYIIAAKEIQDSNFLKQGRRMELINMNNGKVAKILFNLKDKLNLIKVLNHPNYGKCLIVGVDNNKIKILAENNILFN